MSFDTTVLRLVTPLTRRSSLTARALSKGSARALSPQASIGKIIMAAGLEEIRAAAWYFCPHNGVHPGPNRVCIGPCGTCRHKAEGALEAAESVRIAVSKCRQPFSPAVFDALIRPDRPE